MAILFKTGVVVRNYTPALSKILECILILNEQNIETWPKDFWITSINDSTHLPNSKHYKNEALDLRSKNFKTKSEKLTFINKLKLLLGDKFTVLFENENTNNEHFHIQVKKGEVFSWH